MDLFKQKQIMIFSNNEELQKNLERNNWSGAIKKTDSDYLLVVDANLASLKTDPAVKRKIKYELSLEGNDYKARVSIEYDHGGEFDWKTTRYRTYTRIYVPEGSRLISADGFINEQNKKVEADVSNDLDKVFNCSKHHKITWELNIFCLQELPNKLKMVRTHYLFKSNWVLSDRR